MRGLTLIELLVTVTIAGLLLSISLPDFSDWLAVRRATADQRLLAHTINAARTAAIRFNTPVILCPGDSRGCGARNTWHDGAIVFTDHNRNRRIDEDEHIITAFDQLYGFAQWRSFRNRSYLRFEATGLTDWQNGHFLLCPEQPAPSLNRQLVLNYAGRLYPSMDENDDGVHEDVQGKPLQC